MTLQQKHSLPETQDGCVPLKHLQPSQAPLLWCGWQKCPATEVEAWWLLLQSVQGEGYRGDGCRKSAVRWGWPAVLGHGGGGWGTRGSSWGHTPTQTNSHPAPHTAGWHACSRLQRDTGTPCFKAHHHNLYAYACAFMWVCVLLTHCQTVTGLLVALRERRKVPGGHFSQDLQHTRKLHPVLQKEKKSELVEKLSKTNLQAAFNNLILVLKLAKPLH